MKVIYITKCCSLPDRKINNILWNNCNVDYFRQLFTTIFLYYNILHIHFCSTALLSVSTSITFPISSSVSHLKYWITKMRRCVASTQQIIGPNASFTLPSYTAIICHHKPAKVSITLLHSSSTTKYTRSGIM